MGKAHGLALALALCIVGGVCFAQERPAQQVQSSIPFQQIQHSVQQQTTALIDSANSAGANFAGDDSSSLALLANTVLKPEPAAAALSSYRPVSSVAASKTLSANYFLLNGLHLGMALLDVEVTQHCIADHHCQEGNPLMPSSRVGQFSVTFGTFAYASVTSYLLKKHKSRLWWIAPSAGIGAHTAGAATGFAHQ
jgi:hypothetical protein